jgi:hypothetical protein
MNDGSNHFPKNPEKRHYQRIEMELPVEIEIDGAKVSATTENVSCGGMFLPNMETSLGEAQEVVTYINLPERSEAVRMPAKVLRIEKKDGHAPGVALQFHGLYDDNHLAIDRFVKGKLLN